ncbi:BglG family transcription antiterminator [Alteribacter populi]|uniref:BglG family transcription antiterminator n=1 Tax=Alteribacter populi TaxID=2011011 RepID=UPI000BBAE852|nr:BglG family transcription antiterminator [Alteribacter populi]
MSLDQRSSQLLHLLIETKSPISIRELGESLRVSRRTIYYNLEKINDWLKEQKLEEVQSVKSLGVFVTEDSRARIPNLIRLNSTIDYYFTAAEREKLILIALLTNTDSLYLQEFMDMTKVSRNSCLADIKAVKRTCKRYQLEVLFQRSKGYFMTGSEYQIRKLFIDTFNYPASSELSNEMKASWSHFDPHLLDMVKQCDRLVSRLQKEFELQLTSEAISELSWHLAFFIHRVRLGFVISLNPDEREALNASPAYKGALVIADQLSKQFNLTIPEHEVCYFTIFLLSLRNQSEKQLDKIGGLHTVVRKMVIDFQRYSCIEFDNYQAVEQNLLIHIRPAYYRLKYGIQLKNPLTTSVKEKYGEVFQLTKKVVHHLESFFGTIVNEDELAYIAMHFGGWMRKEGNTPVSRKTAVIVCSSGVGTSQILKSQLESLFSTLDFEVVTSIEKIRSDAEIVFTTVSIPDQHLPTFHVNAILSDLEKERLLTYVNRTLNQSFVTSQNEQTNQILKSIGKHATVHNQKQLLTEIENILSDNHLHIREPYKPMLNEIIDGSSIQLANKVDSWQSAVELAAAPLLEKDLITKDYIDAMITNINELGPYVIIAPHVAIPHARPEDGVNKLAMGLLKLHQPIAFSKEVRHQASLIFILAATDNETHLKALSQLSSMLSDEENIDTLINARTIEDLQSLIDKYSE